MLREILRALTEPRPLVPLKPLSKATSSTPSRILEANPRRRGLVISNLDSAAPVFLGFGFNGPAANTGLGITATTRWEMTKDTFYTGEIWAFSSSSTTVGIQEFE